MNTITLGKQQYKDLLKLIFIGDAVLTEFLEDRTYKEGDVSQHIYSQAKAFGLEDWITVFEADAVSPKRIFLHVDKEVEFTECLDDYNEEYFKEYLLNQIAFREAHVYFMKHLMSPGKYNAIPLMTKQQELYEKYAELFERDGLEMVEFVERVDPLLN